MHMVKPSFTVCVLLHGHYTELAERCLSSILNNLKTDQVASIRIGMNDVSSVTDEYVRQAVRTCPVPVYGYFPARHVWKYPLMRRMFYDDQRPIQTPYVMWFDDDSYVDRQSGQAWWDRVAQAAAGHAVIGDVWHQLFEGNQAEAITTMPWYTGYPHAQVRSKEAFRFVTGGWWVADYAFLQKWDYPFPAIAHNGGDRALGELCRQQREPLGRFKEGVHINADEAGRHSKAKRRGGKTTAVWADYSYGKTDSYHHQEFDCVVVQLNAPASEI